MGEFKTTFAENIFNQKYKHEFAETWKKLSSTAVKDVCGEGVNVLERLEPLLSQEEMDELESYINFKKFVPGGRYLYYVGRSLKFYNNCFSGDEKFVTDKGLVTFEESVGDVIVLSPKTGKFTKAEVRKFGTQVVNRIIFATLRGHQKKTWAVDATANHRWILRDESETTNLKPGDVVKATVAKLDFNLDGFRHGLVFADGNTHVQKNGFTHQLRLCGKKSEFVKYFGDDFTITYPGFACGDPIVNVKSDYNLKELPNTNDPEYIASFINGWIALDGHSNKVNMIHSINKDAIEFFNNNCHLAGFVATGEIKVTTKASNYGERKPLYHLHFAFANEFNGFKVVGIEELGEQEVYCVVEPIHNQFTLEYGIATGNCFLLKAEEDTRQEWGKICQRASDCLMSGGGIGIDYSVLRPKNSPLFRTGGVSSGAIPLMKSVNEIGRNVMQGGSRRSAIYASLNWQHGDAKELLHVKDWAPEVKALKEKDFNFPADLDMTNISLNYDDAFLNELENGNLPETFIENVRQMLKTAEPGFSFNFGDKQDETLRNACVPYDCQILTDKGHVQIGEVVGKKVNIWNGFEYSEVIPFETGFQDTLEVELSDGTIFRCTPNHEFIISESYGSLEQKRVKAKDLAYGQKLYKFSLPVVKEGKTYPTDAYSQGFYSGDGDTGCEWSMLYAPKYSCETRLAGKVGKEGNYQSKRWLHGPMLDKTFVPVEGSLDYCLNWFAGLLDSDGSIAINKNGVNIQISSIDKEFLNRVRLMLTRLGIQAKITVMNKERETMMPDGKGGQRSYHCQESYRILLGSMDAYELIQLGLKTSRVQLPDTRPQRDAKRFISVKSITESIPCDTYCFTEPKNNTGTFYGIVTGQCCEVVSADDSDACNLGSINLDQIDTIEELARIVELATKFLMCGLKRAVLPTDKIHDVRRKNSRIGLGLMGVHAWLLRRGYDYEVTPELHSWLKVWKDVNDQTCESFAKVLNINVPKGRRAIAPTGTLGIIASTTTGIEPLFAVAYKRRYLTNGTDWKYEYVIDATAQHMIDTYGIDPDKIETAYSLAKTPEKRIKFQYDVQKYVDMAISSTINLEAWGSEHNNESKVIEFAQLLAKYAHGLRGFTGYPDGARGGQPLTEVSYYEAKGATGMVFDESENKCSGGVCGL